MLAKRLNYGDTIGVTGVSNNIAGESLEQFYQAEKFLTEKGIIIFWTALNYPQSFTA